MRDNKLSVWLNIHSINEIVIKSFIRYKKLSVWLKLRSLLQCLDELAWEAYVKLRSDFDRSINIKDHTNIAIGLEYERKISGIKYELNIDVMTRSKEENKT